MVDFDIFLLGLKDPSPEGRKAFLELMHQLSGSSAAQLGALMAQPSKPLFHDLDRDRAMAVADALQASGARIEIRPASPEPATAAPEETDPIPTRECPRCHFAAPMEGTDCPRCGLVFAKWERESIQRMQKERRLEEALTKAVQNREEWTKRAKEYVGRYPLPQGATAPFEQVLLQDETPFMALACDDGPILLTSRRLIFQREGRVASIPFEVIRDADIGTSFLTSRRAKLQLGFHTPLPLPAGVAKSLSWTVDKGPGYSREVILDWAFARSFLCGSCGARDITYRTEKNEVRFRCMRCATDHEVDLAQAIAIPAS